MFTRFHSYSLSCQTLDGISSVQMHRLTLFDPVQYQTWLRLKLWTPSTRVLDWAEKTEAQCYRMLPHATACYRMLPPKASLLPFTYIKNHQKSSKWLEHILKWIKAKASDLAHLNILYCFQATHFFLVKWFPNECRSCSSFWNLLHPTCWCLFKILSYQI
jgi:hypothetical protein